MLITGGLIMKKKMIKGMYGKKDSGAHLVWGEDKEKGSALEESGTEVGRDEEETSVAPKRQTWWIWSFSSCMHGMLSAEWIHGSS
jgi:hypothetical protein